MQSRGIVISGGVSLIVGALAFVGVLFIQFYTPGDAR